MLLRISAEVHQFLDQLFLRHLLAELDKYSCCMSVQDRNTDTLAGDDRFFRTDDLSVLNMAEYTQRFLLALLFLAADVGDDVSLHLGPVTEGLAGPGDCLISGGDHFIRFKLFPCGKCRCVGLDRAVRLHGDETSLRSESLLLILDHMEMIQIDLRNDHGNVRRPAVSTVIGDYRSLCLRIFFLNLPDLFLGHIHGGEDHIDPGGDRFHFIYIVKNHVLHSFRHGRIHLPSAADRFFVSLAFGSLTCGKYFYLKIRMIGKQGDESLSDHTGCS